MQVKRFLAGLNLIVGLAPLIEMLIGEQVMSDKDCPSCDNGNLSNDGECDNGCSPEDIGYATGFGSDEDPVPNDD